MLQHKRDAIHNVDNNELCGDGTLGKGLRFVEGPLCWNWRWVGSHGWHKRGTGWNRSGTGGGIEVAEDGMAEQVAQGWQRSVRLPDGPEMG